MSEDKTLWSHFTRALKPVTRKTAKTRVPKKSKSEDKYVARQAATKRAVDPILVGVTTGLAPTVGNTLERKREKALREGAVPIDATLDLHGMTQSQAFEALATFMHVQVKRKNRFLLIVTGKGRDGAGVIRAHLPNWLGQLPEAARVMSLRPAAVQHGGSGAFYVLLRKVKAKS